MPRPTRDVRSEAWRLAGIFARNNPAYKTLEISYRVFRWFFQQLLNQQNQMMWVTGPWYKTKSCGLPVGALGPPMAHRSLQPYPASTTCVTNQAQPPYPWTTAVPANIRGLLKMKHHTNTPWTNFPRYASEEMWGRNLTGVTHPPYIAIWPNARPQSPPYRRPLDPPALMPPVPWIAIPHMPKDPFTPPPPDDVKPPEPPPTDKQIHYQPGSPDSLPIYQHLNPPARRNPPPPDTKEKKFSGAGDAIQEFFKIISKGKEAITELDDLLDVFVKSLPKKIQDQLKKDNKGKKYRWQYDRTTPQEKLQLIYDNFGKIDWNKFLEEFVENYIEDKVVGKSIDLADRATHKRGGSSTSGGRIQLPRY